MLPFAALDWRSARFFCATLRAHCSQWWPSMRALWSLMAPIAHLYPKMCHLITARKEGLGQRRGVGILVKFASGIFISAVVDYRK